MKRFWLILNIIWLASSCNVAPSMTPATRFPEQPPATPSIVITQSFTTATLAPTATQAQGPTLTPAPVSSPVPTSTLTPLPTLTTQEAEQFINGLYEDNGGCELPCWWGITPGQTAGSTAKRFLEPFVFEFSERGAIDNKTYEAHISTPPGFYSKYIPQYYYTVQGTVDSISIPDFSLSSRYDTLSNFLNNVGQPEEVWIYSGLTFFKGDEAFGAMLFYPQRGILVSFGSYADIVNNQLEGCPSEWYSGSLFLWASGKDKNFEDWRLKKKWGYYSDTYHPLETATGMDVKTFYETFKDPNNQSCLRTPIEVWPTPGGVVQDWPTLTPSAP